MTLLARTLEENRALRIRIAKMRRRGGRRDVALGFAAGYGVSVIVTAVVLLVLEAL